MNYIKNMEQEKVINLANEVAVQQGQIVSKTLAQNSYVSVTLLHFPKAKKSALMILLVMQWFWCWKVLVSSLWMVPSMFWVQVNQ